MYARLMVMFLFSLLALAGCSSSSLMVDREVSAAADAAEVRDAWDTVCFNYNFEQCPTGVLQESDTTTMGDLYFAGSYATDVDGLLGAIKTEVDSTLIPLPPVNDDLVNATLSDSAWLE